MPAFLIVDPVVCEWNLTSSSPLGNSITQSTEIRMTEPKKSWRSLGCWNGECAHILFTNLGGLWFCWVHKDTGVTGLVLWEVCWPGCSWDSTFHWTGWIRGPVAEVDEVTSSIRFEWMNWNLVLLVVKSGEAVHLRRLCFICWLS